MPDPELTKLKAALRRAWPGKPSAKAQNYIGAFFAGTRIAARISAQVVGNHGTYTVSIEAKEAKLMSACSCYIGKGGSCHHCEAFPRDSKGNQKASCLTTCTSGHPIQEQAQFPNES